MSSSFTDHSSYVICEMSSGPNPLWATGTAERPILTASFTLILRGPRTAARGYDFRTLHCKVSPFDNTYIADSLPARIDRVLKSGEQQTDQQLQVFIPFDAARLARIEELRKVGDLRLRLDCELLFDELVDVGQIEEFGRQVPIWALKQHFTAQGQITINLSRSDWVDRVLPQTGYGQIHLFELPVVPLDRIAALGVAFKALKEAQEQHKNGHYNGTVISCRQALDSVLTARGEAVINGQKQPIPVLSESWKQRLGQSTYEWLNDALGALNRPGNEIAHQHRNFDQFESQMILMLTTTLLAYAARAPQVGKM
ncbi:MAG: hypothetical protein NTV51_25515 [Verrucomicrobia bacterium]|nr:hypothetical protein [Verrucomicrobiota bacterium]